MLSPILSYQIVSGASLSMGRADKSSSTKQMGGCALSARMSWNCPKLLLVGPPQLTERWVPALTCFLTPPGDTGEVCWCVGTLGLCWGHLWLLLVRSIEQLLLSVATCLLLIQHPFPWRLLIPVDPVDC